ncbi:MAG TPA: hypothetical protein DGD08_01940 [Gemmatimonas aurantiaca]|uniref:Uncharacterized protein n=3 Tax=Gemmatimonas aurantiaca TaxID=173480 RepID=C1AAR9_GEMAT|nr:hypothetical protein GAU_2283 [Gemmatimonas aurantiaca T-27]HCT55955.1 hypothetical protein [Gemmatimonas aurantiaca]
MTNQSGAAVLERPRPLSVREAGEQFAAMVRQDVRACGQRSPAGRFPQPAGAFYEMGRDDADVRGLSLSVIGCAIIAIAQSPATDPGALEALFFKWLAWAESYRPDTPDCYATEWQRETRQGAETDVAQARALRALELLDLPGIDAALAENAEQGASLRRMSARLHVMRREVVALRGMRT